MKGMGFEVDGSSVAIVTQELGGGAQVRFSGGHTETPAAPFPTALRSTRSVPRACVAAFQGNAHWTANSIGA